MAVRRANRYTKQVVITIILASLKSVFIEMGTYFIITLYISLIRSILLYASPTWGHTTHRHIQALQVVQHKFARAITGYDRSTRITQLHDCLGLPFIIDQIKQQAKKLKVQYNTHTTNIIRAIGTTRTIRQMTYRTPLILTQ